MRSSPPWNSSITTSPGSSRRNWRPINNMLDTGSQVRSAIERGEFARAGVLWEEWSAELSGAMLAGTLDPDEWARAQELYRWSRNVLVAARTRLLHRLNQLHVAGAYGPTASIGGATFVHGRF